MHDPGFNAFLQLALRWFHIFFGVIWIGHLYFFNFVNAPFQAALDKDLKPKVNPALLLRALWWFRWGAMWTFLLGWTLFAFLYLMGGAFWDADGAIAPRGWWMLIGAVLGSIMWFNVWFVIWPSQKQILGGLLGANPPAPPEIPKKALLFSRINTWLSAPMFVGMIAASHIDQWSAMPPAFHGVMIVLTLAAIHGMLGLAPKKGTGL